MAWKEITLALFEQFRQCLQAKGVPNPYFNEISACFQQTFATGQPDPEPEPEPEPEPGRCYDGFVPLSGFFSGFCGRQADKFDQSTATVGVMEANTEALKLIDGGERWARGFFEVDFQFATDIVPQGAGGLHIMSPQSDHRGLGSPIVGDGYAGWLRPDFQIKPGDGVNATLNVGTYNLNAAGKPWYGEPGHLNHVVDVWATGIPLRPREWTHVRFEWRRLAAHRIEFRLNGAIRTVTISPDSKDLFAFAVGNMDRYTPAGGSEVRPLVQFKDLRFGQL